MDNNSTKVQETLNNQETSAINVAEIFFKMLENWHLFVIAIVVALIGAFLITKYSTSLYEAEATLLIKNNDEMLSNLSMVNNMIGTRNQVNFQNEIGIIQSLSMVKRTIKALDFHKTYYQKVNFRYVDIYKDSPFVVDIDFYQTQPTGVMINVELTDKNKCLISYKNQDNIPVYDYSEDVVLEELTSIPERKAYLKYGEWYEKDGMRFRILLKDTIRWNENYSRMNYAFTINDLDAVAEQFNSTKIELINKESSIISIKFKHENKNKAVDFVNMLCKIYIDLTFEEKTHLNVSTIEFVNSQIDAITDSLNIAEMKRETFQQNNNTLNLTNDAVYLFEQSNELDKELALERTKREYYNSLERYINKANLDGGVAAPSTMGIEDPLLNKLVENLTELIIEKQRLSTSLKTKSPRMKELSLQIESIRLQIQESLRTIKNISDINQRELTRRNNLLQTEIDKLPSTQRNMINIERQFKFNDEIYNFLYQKRAEAEISKNAALPDHKVIDAAKFATQVYPKTILNFLIAILLGILVPSAYIFIRYLLKTTIESKDDLERISSAPILGYIPKIPKEYNKMIVFDKPKSQIVESFRSLRTNIKYILSSSNTSDNEGKVILITSSSPNDGKTLTSLNISSIFSLTGKKTLIVGYDLRKPILHKIFGVGGGNGVSTYLIGKCTLEDALQHTEFPNLDVMVAGPVPPNPSELIDSETNRALLRELRKRYDYIVLDTPPVSLIADAQCLAKESDINLFVVRSNATDKGVLKISLSELVDRNNVRINFILNGVRSAMQKYGYGYGTRYGYGYGYGYGYFDDDQTPKKKSRGKHK